MLAPAPLYADVPARLLGLQTQADEAYVRHATDPAVLGPDGTHLAYWAAAYEARASLAEQNPAFAARLLPTRGAVTLASSGLPLVPAGVRWAVDEVRAGTIVITVDVTGTVTASVTRPGAEAASAVVVTSGPTRSTLVFDAPTDGLYAVALTAGSARLATLLIPVQRAEFLRFRGNSRALAHGFRDGLPRPHGAYVARLARLIAAEAAAQTGQPALYAQLVASAAAVAAAPSPIALYPHG